ncbi:MAG: hypothetical protein HY079_01520 [Elusimicrobia bacterium]|nr:hypothetical protein [Elusimicrobiota bacterium]
MNAFRRCLAAAVAAVLFSTATLHILSHSDLTEASCVVCHMQEASLPGAPAPAVVAVEAPSCALAQAADAPAATVAVRASSARAPPARRA